MKVIIDRFEGEYAVCEQEDRTMINIEVIKLPQEAREGDVLKIDGDRIYIDKNETEKRKQNVEQILDSLWD